jgi:hypothetical protein
VRVFALGRTGGKFVESFAPTHATPWWELCMTVGRDKSLAMRWRQPAVQVAYNANPQFLVRARGGGLNVWTLEEPTLLVLPCREYFPHLKSNQNPANEFCGGGKKVGHTVMLKGRPKLFRPLLAGLSCMKRTVSARRFFSILLLPFHRSAWHPQGW